MSVTSIVRPNSGRKSAPFRLLGHLYFHHGAVLIMAGIQILAIGLFGELQVRQYYTSQRRELYRVDRLLRLSSLEEQKMLLEERDGEY
jgi:hypothetical protein